MTNQSALINRLIGFSEVMHITSLKKTALYELIKLGELKPIKLGRKTVFLESEILAWIDKKLATRRKIAKDLGVQ